MTGQQQRERLLTLLLPALVILVVHVWFVAGGARRELDELEQKLAKADGAQARTQVARRRAALARAERELAAAQAERDSLRRELEALPGRTDDAQRLQAMHQLVDLFGHHGLALVGESQPSGFVLPTSLARASERFGALLHEVQRGGAPAAAPAPARGRGRRARAAPLQQQAAAAIGTSPPAAQAQERQPWSFRLVGRYPDLLRALEELARGDLPLVPAALTLTARDPSAGRHAWTLVVWV